MQVQEQMLLTHFQSRKMQLSTATVDSPVALNMGQGHSNIFINSQSTTEVVIVQRLKTVV